MTVWQSPLPVVLVLALVVVAGVRLTREGGASRRGRAALALVAVPVLALAAACGSDAGGYGEDEETQDTPAAVTDLGGEELELSAGASIVGLPENIGHQPVDASAGAARTTDDMLIYVVTFGSSTCPMVADPTATVTGSDTVEVTFPEPGEGACTNDYVPATSVVALPDDVDPEADLTVTVGVWGEVTLPAGSTDAVWVTSEG